MNKPHRLSLLSCLCLATKPSTFFNALLTGPAVDAGVDGAWGGGRLAAVGGGREEPAVHDRAPNGIGTDGSECTPLEALLLPTSLSSHSKDSAWIDDGTEMRGEFHRRSQDALT